MIETTTPGMCAKHKIVTLECQRIHTGNHAALIALDDLRREFVACNNEENRNAGATFHFVLTVERDNA